MTRCLGLSLTTLALSGTSLQTAIANGDTRTIALHHMHSGEDINITFKREGRYDPEAMEKISFFMRDWRNQKQIRMDPQLFDIAWEVYREVGATERIRIVSAFRSPETNAMLRSRSSAVARHSQHMLGKAMDFYIPGVSVSEIREAGLRLQRGGVGFYPTAGTPFVHLDTGSIRHWPKMTRQQLARVFPDGKTVHVPSDGKPMPGYAIALAEVQARGGSVSSLAFNEQQPAAAPAKKGSLFAFLFGGNKNQAQEEEADEETSASSRPAATPPVAAPETPKKLAPVVVASQTIPVPAQRPSGILASGTLQPPPLPSPKPAELSTRIATLVPLPQRKPETPLVVAERLPIKKPIPSDIAQSVNASFAALPDEILTGTHRERGSSTVLAYADSATPMETDKFLTRKPSRTASFQSGALQTLRTRAIGSATERPLLRGLMIASNLNYMMTVSNIGNIDLSTLSAQMEKPAFSVTIPFAYAPVTSPTIGHFTTASLTTLDIRRYTAAKAALGTSNASGQIKQAAKD